MPNCDGAHKELDNRADGKIHVGSLPEWTRIHGKVAYQVIRGSYAQLSGLWATFPQRALEAAQSAPDGPAGDVYVCTPMDHPTDQAKLLTILYVPLR